MNENFIENQPQMNLNYCLNIHQKGTEKWVPN